MIQNSSPFNKKGISSPHASIVPIGTINSQDSIEDSFKRLHSLPFGVDFFQLVKESRKLGIEYRQYQKLYRTWEREQARKPILKRERQLSLFGGEVR